MQLAGHPEEHPGTNNKNLGYRSIEEGLGQAVSMVESLILLRDQLPLQAVVATYLLEALGLIVIYVASTTTVLGLLSLF